jgi:predicted nucleic acid-binding protein
MPMSARSFIDTNVLVYAFDDSDISKRDRARALLGAAEAPMVISAQVIGEFYVVVTRKLAAPLEAMHAAAVVAELLRLPLVPIDGELARAAVATSQAEQLSYWDALIVESAAVAGCDRLLTEDLSDGATIRSVRVENPFA